MKPSNFGGPFCTSNPLPKGSYKHVCKFIVYLFSRIRILIPKVSETRPFTLGQGFPSFGSSQFSSPPKLRNCDANHLGSLHADCTHPAAMPLQELERDVKFIILPSSSPTPQIPRSEQCGMRKLKAVRVLVEVH